MIVILGSSGFIGKSLCNYLTGNNIAHVGVSSKEIDLTAPNSAKKLSKILSKSTVLIFASSIVREKGDSLENMLKNIDMAVNVASAVSKSPVKKLIFISSIDVYGDQMIKINETTQPNPGNFYGISKLASEMILNKTCLSYKIPFLILRLGGIFGPGQSAKKYGPNSFIDGILNSRTITIYGDGREMRDLVYIGDLIRAIHELSVKKTTGIINMASGKAVSFLQVTGLLKKIFPYDFELKILPRTGTKYDIILDNKKLNSALSKKFKFTNILDALKITVDSFNE